MAYLINPRWIDIPQEAIYQQLCSLGITSWGIKTIFTSGCYRHYLFGIDYAYPYSLPIDVINNLAKALNGIKMTWYKDYNRKAMEYFEANGHALNQAAQYWASVDDSELPRPKILPVDGLNPGDLYIAIIGLFHLRGPENKKNHHLFIDLIDMEGNRIYDHSPPFYLKYGWDGMRADQVCLTAPVRIDKPFNEPGANIGMTWNQVLYGFGLNHIATDRFRGIHTRYGKDEEGNEDGHHSHYIVLQKRRFRQQDIDDPPIDDPPEEGTDDPPIGETVMTINKSWFDSLPVGEDGFVQIPWSPWSW